MQPQEKVATNKAQLYTQTVYTNHKPHREEDKVKDSPTEQSGQEGSLAGKQSLPEGSQELPRGSGQRLERGMGAARALFTCHCLPQRAAGKGSPELQDVFGDGRLNCILCGKHKILFGKPWRQLKLKPDFRIWWDIWSHLTLEK